MSQLALPCPLLLQDEDDLVSFPNPSLYLFSSSIAAQVYDHPLPPTISLNLDLFTSTSTCLLTSASYSGSLASAQSSQMYSPEMTSYSMHSSEQSCMHHSHISI